MLMIIKGHLVELLLNGKGLVTPIIRNSRDGNRNLTNPRSWLQMPEGPQSCKGSKELRAGRGPLGLSRCIEQVGSLSWENLHREPPGPGSSFPSPEYDSVILAFGIGEEERLI